MKKRNYLAILGISAAAAAVIISAVFMIAGALSGVPAPSRPSAPAAQQPPDDKGIVVSSPAVDAKISSPLIVAGTARGWYFEGSFPVELKDANGNSLAFGVAQAQGDWMTAEPVPFVANLVFAKPTTSTGAIILKKDNPSGLPAGDAQVIIPISFSQDAAAVPERGCRPAGCSGQICSDQDVVSTCEYTAAYACYKTAACERQSGGRCGWTATPELESCLSAAGRSSLNNNQIPL